MQLVNTTTLSNIYPKDRTYNNRYKITIYTYLISQSGTGSSGVSNFQIIMHGEDTASSGYINWSGYDTTKLYVNGSLVKSVDCKTIKPTSEGGTDIMTYDFSITHSAGSGTASFTFNASSTTSSDGAVFMIGNWSIDAQTISSGSIVFPSLPDTYTVSYNSGIATSGSAPASQTKTYGVSLTLRTNTGSLAKANDTSTITTTFNGNGGSSTSKSSTKTTSYSFSKWNTQSNGNGTDYTSGGTYTGNGALTLYPKFTSSTSYGSITTPSSSRTGYTFNGWFTATSGGTKYGNSGESKTPTSSQTYYAQWTANTYTVTIHHRIYGSTADFATTTGSRTYVESYTPSYTTKTGYYGYSCTTISANTTDNSCICYYKPNPYSIKFNANGGSGYMANKSMTYDTADNLTANAFTRTYYITYNGNGGSSSSYSATVNYTFNKWFTNASGTGTSYSDGESVNNLTSVKDSTFNLYASWNSVATVLPTATRAGYTFSGWYNGSTRVGGSGDNFTPTSNVTLKAEWVGIPYTLQFNGNGATSGTMSDMAMVFGSYSQLTANDYAKTGSTFVGWNTQADGSGTSYKDGVSVINLMTPTATGQSTELYAQWESIIPISLHADSTNNVADGVAIGKKSEGGNKFEIGFDTEIGNSTTNFHLKLNGQEITAGQTGNIDDVKVNGSSVVSNRVANITSIPASIVQNYPTYSYQVTVTGDANTYYPVVITMSASKKKKQEISVWRNLGETCNSTYPGNHSGGTSSMWLQYEGRTWYWDGNGGYLRTSYFTMPYATLCAKAEMLSSSNGNLAVYLRGGTTLYHIDTSPYSTTVNVYYERTNIGSSSYPVYVEPVTTLGNQGIVSNADWLGNIASSTKATQDSDGNQINTTYFKKSGGEISGNTTVNGELNVNNYGVESSFGALNNGWCHIMSKKSFYMGNNVFINGNLHRYETGTYGRGTISGYDLSGNASTATNATYSTYIQSPYYYSQNLLHESDTAATVTGGKNVMTCAFGDETFAGFSFADTIVFSGYQQYGATEIATQYDTIKPRMKIRKFVQSRWGWGDWTEILTEGSCKDWVISQGTSGVWYYRIWNSGKTECWALLQPGYQTASGYTEIGTGGGTYSRREVAWPVSFSQGMRIQATVRENVGGTFFAEDENSTTTKCIVTAVGNSNVTSVDVFVYAMLW